MADYGSATINAVNNQRDSKPYQEPIGATNDVTPDNLINGTIGGGFAAVDTNPNFTITTPGQTDGGKAAYYAVADVDIAANSTAVVLNVGTGHITAATGGTYTARSAIKTGQYGWVSLT